LQFFKYNGKYWPRELKYTLISKDCNSVDLQWDLWEWAEWDDCACLQCVAAVCRKPSIHAAQVPVLDHVTSTQQPSTTLTTLSRYHISTSWKILHPWCCLSVLHTWQHNLTGTLSLGIFHAQHTLDCWNEILQASVKAKKAGLNITEH